MIFNSLRINNYRAYYGECNFDFPIDGERNISILYADNDVGKSCFFSAILFCLYGPKDSDDLKDLINVNAQSEKCYHAAVSLFVENGSDKIEISRTIDLRGKLEAMQKPLAAPHRKSYCPYTEKPPQAVSSPILNPNSCVFWNGGKDSTGRTLLLSGNSACRDGHSPCIACYTGVCRSRPGRTTNPDAISCSGS